MRTVKTRDVIALEALTDSELVELTREGRPEAFGQLVLRYRSRIYRLARRLADTDEDAEDVLQEALIKAFKSISTFEGRAKFSTWLYRITVNLALMKKRSSRSIFEYLDDPVETKRGEVRREFPDKGPDPLGLLMEKECRGILDRAILELAPADRAVFVLRHVDGLSTVQASEALKLSVPALKSRLHRSRVALQGSLRNVLREEVLAASA
ncbi:MAG: sigma-70 family RNA polymerase sigma factor [bacterium]|jgi:RNA polymerase sigma-70 factor (ECF subfamily)